MLRTIATLAASLFFAAGTGQYVHVPFNKGGSGGGCSSGSYTDTFVRANGALGSPWNYVNPGGAITVVSNAAAPGLFSTGDQIALLTGCTGFGATQSMTVTVATPNFGYVGAAVDGTSMSSTFYAYCAKGLGGCFVLGPGNTFINFFSGTDPTTGQTVCLGISGTTLTLKVNGTITGTATVTPQTGVPGIYFNNQDGGGAGVASITNAVATSSGC